MINTNPTFTTTIHGKWILTGEHAVVRGQPAIIFPIKEKTLQLQYFAHPETVEFVFEGDHLIPVEFLFRSGLKRAAEILALNENEISGKFLIKNNIPVACGMGGSAVVCVALSQWFLAQNKIAAAEVFEFSRQLENVFHHESSGADIAVAIANTGIIFSRNNGSRPIQIAWQPHCYLSFSGISASTADCVQKVKNLWLKNAILAKKIDAEMLESVTLAEKSLQLEPEKGLPLLIAAIKKGYDCFAQWDLLNNGVMQHIAALYQAGALAAKPTGSGDGGFILSLWPQEPPQDLGLTFIKLF